MFLVWSIVSVVLIMIEIYTASFFWIFFAIGCLFSALSSLLIVSIETQILIMCIVAFLGLIFGRRILQNYFQVNKEIKLSNINALIGKTGIVIKEIDKDMPGLVRVDNEVWSAISSDNETISERESIVIKGVEGVKLLVHRI